MINIFIDSNIFISLKYNVFSGPLKSLERYREKGIVCLYTNDIICREVARHLKKESEEATNSVLKVMNKPMIQVALKLPNSNISELISAIPLNMDTALNDFFAKSKLIQNDLVSIGKVLNQYFDVVPPFEDNEKKKAEFPDAIIIESIKHRNNINDLLYVVSDDKGWAAAFPDGNSYNVTVVDSIYAMTNKVACKLLDEDILNIIQKELKQQLLERATTWIEEYDYSKIIDYDDQDMIECDALDSAELNSIKLYLNGIDFVDSDERTATLDFEVESVVEIEYFYIDHSDETYDREDNAYYNTKHGKATKKLRLRAPMEVFVTVSEINDENQDDILSIDDIEFQNMDVEYLNTDYDEYVEYDDEPFAHFSNLCPDCGVEITESNDGLNGFCNKCAPNH